jgi:sugar diacid utilization regulator
MKVSLYKVVMAVNAIRNLEKEKASVRFSYGIMKNKAKMQPDIAGLETPEKEMNEKLTKLEKEREVYCLAHCAKNEKGEPVKAQGRYLGVDGGAPELVAIVKAQMDLSDKYNAFLKSTETDIDFHMIDFKEVPEQISPVDFEGISIFIKEPTENNDDKKLHLVTKE